MTDREQFEAWHNEQQSKQYRWSYDYSKEYAWQAWQAARAAPAQGYATLTGDNRLIWHNRAAPAQPEGEK